jgi:hypothetical protein
MPVDPKVKKQWEKLQSQYNYPVDATGRPIDPKDQKTLKVWRDEGIDVSRSNAGVCRLVDSVNGKCVPRAIYHRLWHPGMGCWAR